MRKLAQILTNTWLLLACILVLSSVFRLPLLHYAEFKGDEALNLFLAARPIFHHPFPPASQASSAGILNFPLLNYLLFPIVLFTLYPPSISFVIALLNVLTIGGFFLIFSKYHGKVVAFLSSSILALSPWAILYSRKIWAQDFLLPLSLPFFVSMYKILEGKKQYWFLFGLSSMLLLQIHQLAIIVPFLVFIFLLLKRHTSDWKLLILGSVVGLIPTIPYFWYMASLHFSEFQSNSSLGNRFSFHDLTIFLRPLQIISLGDFHTEMGNDFALFASKFHWFYLLSKLNYIAYFLLLTSAIYFWIKNKTYRFFIVVCFVNLLLFFLFGIEPLMHYFILLIPFLALFIGSFLSYLFSRKNLFVIGFILFSGYIISLITFNYSFLALLAQKGGFAGDYGSGFATTQASAKTDLAAFKQDKNYSELLLYYYLPTEYFHGYMPVGKMIFPASFLNRNHATFEKQFLLAAANPLLATEVFAYYTQSPSPSWDYVVSLKEKTRQNAAYNFIYQKVLGEYLSLHFKRLYETPDFLLLYPAHWSEVATQDGAIISDDSIEMHITQTLTLAGDARFLRAHYYLFTLDYSKTPTDQTKQYAEDNFRDILSSIRGLQ